MSKFLIIACFTIIISCVVGHGTVHDPVARQTRWRYDSSAPANYDDVGVYCGGISVNKLYFVIGILCPITGRFQS